MKTLTNEMSYFKNNVPDLAKAAAKAARQLRSRKAISLRSN
jgi:hypothetical protein